MAKVGINVFVFPAPVRQHQVYLKPYKSMGRRLDEL